jgi:hypothetical protein
MQPLTDGCGDVDGYFSHHYDKRRIWSRLARTIYFKLFGDSFFPGIIIIIIVIVDVELNGIF